MASNKKILRTMGKLSYALIAASLLTCEKLPEHYCGDNQPPYNPLEQFCYGEMTHSLCGGQTYTPGSETCHNGTPHRVCADNTLVPRGTDCDVYRLSVGIDPTGAGSASRNPDLPSYAAGSVVTVTAEESNPHFRFVRWSGASEETSKTVEITMDGSKSVTAEFERLCFPLATPAVPTIGGSVTRIPQHEECYPAETEVTLIAESNTKDGYIFKDWTGAAGTSNTIAVTMERAKTVTANFELQRFKLETNPNPETSGSITRSLTEPLYTIGTEVTLTANPITGYNFIGWSGDATGNRPSVTVKMDSDKKVTATFVHESANDVPLRVDSRPAEGGSVILDPVSVASTYTKATTVTLTPNPAPGYKFIEWEGSATGTANPLKITMDGGKVITAVFEQITYTLTTNTQPENGSYGTVIRDPAGPNYPAQTTVTLTANPASGYRFTRWIGDYTGTTSPIQIPMDRNKSVTAVFEAETYTLTTIANPTTGGTVSPQSQTYLTGVQAEVTAATNPCYTFTGWTGATTSASPKIFITMDGNKTVTANWAVTRFNVLFDANGGIPASINAVEAECGKPIGTPLPKIMRVGFNFVGWFDENTNTEYKENMPPVNNAVTLTARWATKRYTVTFDANGGATPNPSEVTVDSGGTLGAQYPVDPTRDGYRFDGWFEGTLQYGASTVITKAVTLTARWIQQYTVSFNANGGNPSTISAVSIDSGSGRILGALPTVTRAGYTFGGWFEGTTWTTQYYASTLITKSVTLTARWVPQYTVSFNTNGGNPGTISAVIVDSGTNIGASFPANPTRDGYTFAGWLSGGVTRYVATSIITNNTNLSARWTAVETPSTTKRVTVSFDTNGGTPSTISPITVDSGRSIGSGNYPDPPKRTGYNFNGWYRGAGTTPYQDGTVISSDITLTAKWTMRVAVVVGTFIDSRNNKRYKTVKLGNQTWMAENLNYATNVNNTDSNWCYSNNNANCDAYGRLYNWSAAKNACPNGWHLPSRAEWDTLAIYAGSSIYAGKALKSTTGWNPNNGTDDFEFTALSGGQRSTSGSSVGIGTSGRWWSATEVVFGGRNGPLYRFMSNNYDSMGDLNDANGGVSLGFSVRCVQN